MRKKIHELEEKEPRLSGALPFVDSHLHNDLIDTLSTRGIPGVVLTILAFSAIFIYALRTAKEPYILILLFSLLVVGLSDVILFSKPVPTAVFVTNYDMTLGAIMAAHERGVTLPDEMDFIGYDNVDLCSIVSPKLEIVEQPMNEMGLRAAELLLARLGGDASPAKLLRLKAKLSNL